jgi:hypothetical protein
MTLEGNRAEVRVLQEALTAATRWHHRPRARQRAKAVAVPYRRQ